jgi:predicted nucleic acid-binding protein
MTNLYIDTNIIVYANEDSKNIYGKEIAVSSSNLIWQAICCKYNLIISSWTLEELRRIKKLEQAQMLFNLIDKKKILVAHSQEDIKQAKIQNPGHFQDELHGILALKSKADYIVTRNIKDFEHFKDRIKVTKPESLL